MFVHIALTDMNAEQNERLTRITPGTPRGQLLRQYWQPAALVDEFNPLLDPRMPQRPVKAIQLLGQLPHKFTPVWTALVRECRPRWQQWHPMR